MPQFNFRTVLRKCARPILADFFEHHGAFSHGIDRAWMETPDTRVDDILAALQNVPDTISRIIENELHNANELTTPQGMEILMRQVHSHDLDVSDSETIAGLLERAI